MRWAYLVVDWRVDAENVGGEWRYENVLRVRALDGQSTEERYPAERPSDADPVVELFNRLGADGWELVTATVTESAVAGASRRGHHPASYPTGFMWTFKRALP